MSCSAAADHRWRRRGEEKAQAIYAALIGKRINGLVTEETTARAVLTLAS